jgi:hypothetical protein
MGMTSDLVSAMADGIGEFTYLSEEWIGAAREQLTRLAELQSEALAGKQFVFCEVAHDEMSKRTAGDLPGDYDDSIKPEWATPNQFDRPDGYDKSWLRYDEVDIFGDPR